MDLESPLCLDLDLMNRHFTELSQGKRIYVPKYEFSRQMRIQEPSKSIKLKKDEMVVFEGIHALNDMSIRFFGWTSYLFMFFIHLFSREI